MLDEKDLQAIATLINSRLDTKIDALESRLDTKINALDARITALDSKIDTKTDMLTQQINRFENTFLEELDRVQDYLETRIEKVEKNQEELQQYYRITKLENDNSALILKMVQDLALDVEDLKQKIA